MTQYHRLNPFYAHIKEKIKLTKPGSKKETHHIVLDLKGSNLTYQVGDSIGIYPRNHPIILEKTLSALKTTGKELVVDKEGRDWVFKEWLEKKANLREVSRRFLGEVAERQTNLIKKHELQVLLESQEKEHLKAYLETHEVWDLLKKHSEVNFSAQEIVALLMPLLPRLYSISSFQPAVGEEVHLTVALLKYQSGSEDRHGICSHLLCHHAPLLEEKLPIYIQSSHGFTLPAADDAPMIMIGPGTGVAPFRAFMQERLHRKALGKNWLFFGECNQAYDFFYEEDWRSMEASQKLKLSLAFSRDQEHKVYVQHRMLEEGEELWRWLQNGAHLYVCGDAKRMAKDVETTLQIIIEKHGQKESAEAKALIKQMRADKRYLRDVY